MLARLCVNRVSFHVPLFRVALRSRSWQIDDMSLSTAKNRLDTLLSVGGAAANNPLLKGISLTHQWDVVNPNNEVEGAIVSFKVVKMGTSTIQFLIKPTENGIHVSEQSREISFLHSAFASSVESHVDKMVSDLKKKE